MIVSGTTELVTFKDSEDHLWTFDVGFMLSTLQCTWGNGCPGIFSEGGTGCCGVGFTFEQDEHDEIQDRVDMLTAEDWDNHDRWHEKKWWTKREGDLNSRTVDHDGKRLAADDVESTCIFNNVRSGTGCAFHKAALRVGERPIDWKPDTCWQVPLHTEYEESETFVGPMKNLHWGQEEHEPLHWWCTESHGNTVHDAYVDHDKSTQVYCSLREELIELVGAEVYGMLHEHCRAFTASVPSKPMFMLTPTAKFKVGYPNAPVVVAIRNARGRVIA